MYSHPSVKPGVTISFSSGGGGLNLNLYFDCLVFFGTLLKLLIDGSLDLKSRSNLHIVCVCMSSCFAWISAGHFIVRFFQV